LVVNPNPSPVSPTPLEVCDDDNDGFAEFTLEDKDVEIIGGEPDVTVVYYLTEIDARLGDPAGILVSPYANVVVNLQTVWARVENTLTGCFSVIALDLVVNPLPDSPVVPGFGDLLSCDVDGGGSAIFNLEDNTPFVYGVQDPLDYSISYHTDAGDADAGINPVGVPTAFVSTGQTIWVRLENNETLCYRVSSFELIVGIFPLIASPGDMEVCDDEAGGSTTDGIAFFDLTLNDGFITMGDPDLTVFYYETAADQAAGIFIDPATAYENLTNPMTLFVSVFNSTGCDAQTTLSLFVNPNPSSVAPTPLVFCDPNGDGFGEFMLTDKDAEIIGGEPGVMVSYHETLADAENNIFALTSPYANIVANAQTVYARAYFEAPPTSTGCYSIVPLDLIVSPGPEVPIELPPLVLCDDDGFGIFDLTQQDALIYGVQDPSLFILTYHVSLADALSGLNPIATPETFVNTITPEQTIYYRLALIESGCFATGEFLLQVSLGPVVIQPEPLNSCDDLGEPNDGITTFDLTLKSDEITGGAVGVEVRYYETQEDADGDINRIAPETAYVNTTNPQTVYVRVIDGNTECYDTSVTLSLRVVPNPTPVTPTPIELCDDTNPGDGMEVFDLTIREGEILNGATWDLLYYEDEMEAIAGDPAAAIVDPTMYTNLSTPQIIYVRVMIPISSASPDGCFEIVELEIIVHPLPDDTALVTPYVICEIGSDGLFIFDLTTKIPEILGGQDPLLFAVTFYHSSSDAMVGLNPIINTTTYQNISNPETIYTGIVNVVTGCYIGGVQFFDLEVLEGATATPPAEPYTICDNTDPNDGIADFTLYNLVGDPDPDPMADALAAEILGGQSTPPYELLYYGTLADAELGDPTLVLPNVYTNVINPQVIYGRVTNTDTGCYEIVEVILKVEQLPFVNLAEFYRLCVDSNGNPIPEEEGELSPPVIDTGLDPAFYDIVWEYPGGTAVGPSIIAIVEGVYTVTYTEIETGCSGTSSTTVTISQPPITYDAILLNGAFSENQSIQASATGLGTYVFQLDNGAFIDSGLFEDVSPGTHTITIKDVNGCGSVTIEIGVVDYPQFMTPNQDGYHDTWNIIGIAEFDPTAKIYIFDRFGKLLKQVSPLGDGWDGTYNGNPLPSSDYWFLIEYTEDDVQKEFKGHFTLKR
jgi:gliding motility-associated-like protein